MGRSGIAAAAPFVACLVGALYAAMMLGCFLHEVVGHGLTAVVLGGTFHEFVVDPAAHGHAFYDDLPEDLAWAPLWGGIVVNLLVGAAAVLLSRRRPPLARHAALALLAVGATHTGQALGYSLQGAFSGRGDARWLHDGIEELPRWIVIAALAAAYLAMVDWALRGLVRLVDHQFAPESADSRRRWFLGTVLAPFAVLAVARPGISTLGPTVNWLSRAALVVVVGAWGVWRAARHVGDATPRTPLGGRGAALWLLAALAFAVLAAAWTAEGVEVRWG